MSKRLPMNKAVEAMETDIWKKFRYFLGDWGGGGTGKSGESTMERSYRLTLDDQFIEMRGRSLYPPQEKNPSGEDHREIGLLSYDKNRSRYVLREFHVEGYVNHYVLETAPDEPDTFVFVTEAIENIPAGWRARTTIKILTEDSFQETFDLAGPGEAWACYIISVLHRIS
jgi:hypothetical protein